MNLTARICEALLYGPRSAMSLAKHLGVPERAVASRCSQLKCRAGSGILIYDRSPTRYVHKSWLDERRRQTGAAPPKLGTNVAGPITIGRGYRWFTGRVRSAA